MPAEKLHDGQEQEEHAGSGGIQKVLPVLQKAHGS
jgi:hypothetical protein